MLVSAVAIEASDDRKDNENESDNLVPQGVDGLYGSGKNVFYEHLALFNGILLHRVAGQGFPEEHNIILAPAMKGFSQSADYASVREENGK
jgi:hypothetical protein